MPLTTEPRDAWEHARRLLPGRVLRLAFADERTARAYRLRLYRVRAAERVAAGADPDPAAWGASAWDGLEIVLARPQLFGETYELRIARAKPARVGPIEISVGSA